MRPLPAALITLPVIVSVAVASYPRKGMSASVPPLWNTSQIISAALMLL
jgi:hypothetical protein